jgi:hypothetical protein
MIADLREFLAKRIPEFASANRGYLTIAIGCTGGQHRSVYIAEQLAAHFRAIYPQAGDDAPRRAGPEGGLIRYLNASIASSRPARLSGYMRPSSISRVISIDGGVPPVRLRLRIDPGELRVGLEQALQPNAAGLGIPVLDAAARLSDFVRAHGRIAHQNQFVVGAVGAHHLDGADVLAKRRRLSRHSAS